MDFTRCFSVCALMLMMWVLPMQEAAGKEDEIYAAERNPAAVKYTGNLVSWKIFSKT